jgi:excisionase family DNA binding protein
VSVIVSVTLNGVEVPLALGEEALATIAAAVPPVPLRNGEEVSPYMTVAEAADRLRCSRQRIYDLLSSGRLKRLKDGSRTLLRREELDDHLNGRRG